MKYYCTNCSYVYDEITWEEELNIAPMTMWWEIDEENFYCPNCESTKEDFIAPKEEIIYPNDQNNLTAVEAMHFPVYEIKWDELHFKIWEDNHPMNEEHFIYKISLIDENWDIIEEKKFNQDEELVWSFDISYLSSFELRVYCNEEGIFSSWVIEV